MIKNQLITAIKSKRAKIGVIGLGYVGLPLVIRFAEEGFKTIGFDIDQRKIDKLNNGKTYIKHIPEKKIISTIKAGFVATTNFQKISTLEAIIICVPTPLGDNNTPDLSFINNTLESIKPYLKQKQLLILESTTYPGTTEEEILPVIEDMGFLIGENFFIGYSPEREDPGNKKFTTKNIPKVVSGYTENCLEICKKLYDQIVDKIIPVSSLRVAEMTKILENIYRAVNIGLVNELKIVADKMDIDIYEVINAAKTKPFGFTPYYPGPGLGGHCIPIDPFYLSWKAGELGVNTRFIKLAGEINTKMPEWVVGKLKKALKKNNKDLKGAKILILGLAYKKNLGDTRESPAFPLIKILREAKAQVEYSDPHVAFAPKTRKYNYTLKSLKLSDENITTFDAIILVTDHDDFDYVKLQKNANLLVDTRGKFKLSKNIIRA